MLGIGLATAMHLAQSADNLAYAQFAHYEPYMAVDIADLADPESDLADTLHGEAMDVNAEMFACGWYEDSGAFSQPFFLDPRDGGDAYILPLSTYEFGAALALSESEDYDITGIIVVGWVQDYPAGDKLAAYWEHNGTTWELNLVPDLTSGYDSYATDVGPDGDYAVGYEETGAGIPHPFIFDHAQDSTSIKAFIATAMGIDKLTEVMTGTRYNGGDEVAYHYVLGAQSPTDLPNPDDETYEETYGMAVNEYDDVVGYALDTDTGTKHGVLWYYDDDPDWTPYVLEDDNPDPVESTLTDVSNKDDGTVDIVGTYSDGGAFYVTIDDNGDYYSYSLDQVSSGPVTHLSFVLFPLRIRREVEEHNWTPETYSANGINSIGTIAGGYWDGAPSDDAIRPCLFVANDMNNNGEPDFREILQSQLEGTLNLDQNGNWMLDWAENIDLPTGRQGMRVGLHAPGPATYPEGGFDPVQVVRLKVNIIPRGANPPEEIEDEDFINDILDVASDCTDCTDFLATVSDWGTGDGRSNEEQTEVLIRVHSMFGDETLWGDFEGIPADSDTRTEALEDIRSFAYRFAHCLDWLQWGNESFGGQQSYKIRGDDLETCTWQGDAVKYTTVANASTACLNEATQAIIKWQEEQMEAGRIGSALAGRPLRMTASGVHMDAVINGYGPDNDPGEEFYPQRYLITELSDYSDRNRAWFSMHVHYLTVDSAIEAITKLIDTYDGDGAPWNVPMGRISTEVGAKADTGHTWFTDDNGANLVDFARFYFGEDAPVNYDFWEDFVTAWMYASTGQWGENGPQIGTVFNEFDDAGFNAICYGALQYSKGSSGDPSPHLLEALRATRVRSDAFFKAGNTTNKFTPLKSQYITEGAAYKISDFEPHNEACDPEHACPGCQ